MPKKKRKSEEIAVPEVEPEFEPVENLVAPEVEAQPVPEPSVVEEVSQPAEPLLQVRAKASFHDGAFINDFARYGYKKLYWTEGEVRRIPEWLFRKLNSRSGGQFEKYVPRP
jgi:hypothetical protein